MDFMTNTLKSYSKLFLVIIFLFVFALLANNLLGSSIYNMDGYVYETFVRPLINDTNTSIFRFITELSGLFVLAAISVLSFFVVKKKRYSFFIVLNLFLIVVLNLLLKQLFLRERPTDLMLIDEGGYSFPSGHAMAVMAFYGLLIYFVYKSKLSKIAKWISSCGLSAIILLVGFSRIYLGVHYMSDILAGFCVSVVYLLVFTLLISKSFDPKEKIEKKGPLWRSFYYAFQGIIQCIKLEKNMAIHFSIILLVIMFGIYFHISTIEWFVCIILFGMVVSLELVNTSLENTIDICMPKLHPKAKIAKDTSAGAVLVAAITSVIIGLMIFVPKIIEAYL